MKKLVYMMVAATLAQFSLAEDKRDIELKALVHRLEVAWDHGDAAAWSKEFAEDADFTVWTGLRQRGRKLIQEGHAMIFSGPYKGTKLEMKIDGIRWIKTDVAILLTQGPQPGGDPKSLFKQTMVVMKHKGRWQIEAFQNTRCQEFQSPSGDH